MKDYVRAAIQVLRVASLVFGLTVADSALAQSGPVGYWKLDDGTGTSVADSSGGSHTGTFVNSPTWTATGRINGALTFGGTTAAVSVPGTGNLADLYLTGMSISAWIQPTSAGGGGKGRILDKAYWMLRMGSANTLEFIADQWSTTFAQRTSTATIGTSWQHVAVTWTGSQTGTNIHIYINGVLADGASVNAAGTASSDAGLALKIGNNTSGNRGFAGSLDDVRIYNRILTSTEIQALADGTAPGTPGTPTLSGITSSQITVNWGAATDNVAVTGYRLERCTGSGCTTGFSEIATPSTTSYTNTGLAAATTYRYRVRATDANTNLGLYSSASLDGTTAGGGGDTQAPSVPSGLIVVAASSNEVDLAWNASTDNVAVTGYEVERCQGATCSNLASPITSYNDTGRSASTSYTYRVRAKDAASNFSGYSTPLSLTTAVSSPDCE